MKKTFIIVILLSIFGIVAAQNGISNIRIQVVDTIVVVTYDLEIKANIEAFVSFDNGNNFIGPLKEVTGAVGKDIMPEKNKIVIWNVVQELGYVDYPNAVIKVTANPIIEEKPIVEKKPVVVEEKKLSPKEERRLANKNVNGHYFSLGSSLASCGYYGAVGFGYEYRYKLIGTNFAIGFGTDNRIFSKNINGLYNNAAYDLGCYYYILYYCRGSRFDHLRKYLNANVGIKLYLSNKKTVLRNIYFNFLPFSYFGQTGERRYYYDITNDNETSMIKNLEFKFPHLYGIGLFLGYSPVWHVSKNVALGLNFDIGAKFNYKFDRYCYFNWDLGFVMKFSGKINEFNK